MSGCRAVVSVGKVCQRCGAPFACGLSCCWCDEIAMPEEVRESLQRQFSDCLCRACLEALVSGGSPPGRRHPAQDQCPGSEIR